ncbi:MAG TPA: hypothetical protein VK631_20395 [Solirubrobacteraceae bacterium]|nr:hypothetical protein [Solirubrobacteraceae bacterium]
MIDLTDRWTCVECGAPAIEPCPEPRCLVHAEQFYRDLVRIGAALATLHRDVDDAGIPPD